MLPSAPRFASNPRPGSQMQLAESLLHALKAHGAREIFGIPGDFVLPCYKVIETSRILPHFELSHEPAVGFAADAAARTGFANGAFEDAEEEGEGLVEEFFSEGEASPVTGSGSSAEGLPEPPARPSLRDKLDRKAQQAEPLVLAEPKLS